MDLSNWENIFGLCLIIITFIGGGIVSVFDGLYYCGAIGHRGINKEKWTGTIAKVGNFRRVVENHAVRKYGKNDYWETSIEYEVNGVKYNKYVRSLLGNSDRVRIYYKNKNPDYFKLKSDVRNSRRINKTAGIFLIFIGIIMILSGCFILSVIFCN